MQSWNAHAAEAPEMIGTSRRAGLGESDGVGGHARAVLRGVLRDPERIFERQRQMRAALRALCGEAQAHGLPAERLLLVLKEAWRELPGASRAALNHDDTVLGRVISLCIEEYYEPGRRG